MDKTLVVASGGIDSTVLAYHCAEFKAVELVTFRYGQKHVREAEYATALAERLNVSHDIVMLPTLWGSALTTPGIEVPTRAYDKETMSSTVVPNRNAIMLSVAVSMAVARGIREVAIGVHGGDHHIYPDCRPIFVATFTTAMYVATEGKAEIYAPFVYLTKAQIIQMGAALDVDFAQTYSCYQGKPNHCGLCGTCNDRKKAFRDAGVHDPTLYDCPDLLEG